MVLAMSSRPSPLPNRVSPFGEITATPVRGLFVGNRGIIHRDYKIAKRCGTDGWVICVIDFRGRRRPLMSPGTWTELFFLDEATAFAAGHRPCFYCQRPRAAEFAKAWGHGAGLAGAASAKEMDAVMKRERRHIRRLPDDAMRRRENLPVVTERDLATGAMVESQGEAFLFADGQFLRWSFGGYAPAKPSGPLRLLTPPSVNDAFGAGFFPVLHSSAGV